METGTWNGYRIVLASGSPRRLELLRQIGMEPEVRPSTKEEKIRDTRPEQVVLELSAQKAEDVAAGEAENMAAGGRAGTLVIGADTIVSVDGEILGKPKSGEDAMRMLRLLEGRTHQVYTGVTMILCGYGGRRKTSFSEKTEVAVYPMSAGEIEDYVQSGEPMDKAGAYAIQGKFACFIRGIDGDYCNVVGLPVGRVYQEMKHLCEEESV